MFTREDGLSIDPDMVTDEFERLAFDTGLPPVSCMIFGMRLRAACTPAA